MTKILVEQKVSSFYTDDLEGSIHNVISYLQNFADQYPEGIIKYGEWDSYSTNEFFALFIKREETDAEYERRILKEEVQKGMQLTSIQQQAEELGYTLTKIEE